MFYDTNELTVRCPTCNFVGDVSVVETISRTRLEIAYTSLLGRRPNFPHGWDCGRNSVTAVRCRACATVSFPGEPAGDSGFYASLSSAYPEHYRYEWAVCREQLHPDDVVLDVGSGPGNFLSLIAGRVEQRAAIDSNPVALAALERSEVAVHAADLSDSEALQAAVSAVQPTVVVAFQVIEHLPEPTEFLRALVSAAPLNARFFLSVPNERRTPLTRVGPFDWPPHHLTRWSATSFMNLLENCGLRIDRLLAEPFGSRRRNARPWLGTAIDAAGYGMGLWYGGGLRRPLGHTLIAFAARADAGDDRIAGMSSPQGQHRMTERESEVTEH